MNILIIEDEIKTAKALGRIITDIIPQANILQYIESVSQSVEYLTHHEAPDILFMDIQLADGTSFEIFEKVKISAPIVFCTAFDEYAIEAFKTNGVDYILKPFQKSDIQIAFNKIEKLKNYFQHSLSAENKFETILKSLLNTKGKSNFLVFLNNKYINIPTEKIAYFYCKFGGTYLVTFDQKEYAVPQSLDEIGQLTTDNHFFRINRQYMVSFTAISAIEHFFSRKLLVTLSIPTSEKLLVTKERVSQFLKWLEER